MLPAVIIVVCAVATTVVLIAVRTRRRRRTLARESTKRVLVVANDRVGLSTIQKAVREMGWLMESIAEPPAAIELARRLLPDLLCIDLAVAGEPGFALCGHIRGDATLQHTRILGISNQATMDALKKAESVGVNAYVRKPLTREKFIKYATALILQPFNPPFPPAGSPEAATAPRLVIRTRANDEGSRRD